MAVQGGPQTFSVGWQGLRPRFQIRCERCDRPLGRYYVDEDPIHGLPVVLNEVNAKIRGGTPNCERGFRKGRRLHYGNDGRGGLRYRWDCRCGRTILVSTKRLEQIGGAAESGTTTFFV